MQENNSLPPVLMYTKYLEQAANKFKITIVEARNKFGLYTIGQWEKLLNNNK